MIEKELSDSYLKLLVESAFQKLEKTEEIDSKISSEKSNTLNWILALTTLFIGIDIQNFKSITTLGFKEELFLAEKIIFAFSVIMLIAYKFMNTCYEIKKKAYLANLHTHKLELLFDLKAKLRPKLTEEQTFISSFINRFRNGKFIPDNNIEMKDAFKIIDRKVKIYGKLLKLIYSITMTAFVINLIITTILIVNIKNSG